MVAILVGMLVSTAPACAPAQTHASFPSDIVPSDKSTPSPTSTPSAYTVQDVWHAVQNDVYITSMEQNAIVQGFFVEGTGMSKHIVQKMGSGTIRISPFEDIFTQNQEYISDDVIKRMGNIKLQYWPNCSQAFGKDKDNHILGLTISESQMSCYYVGGDYGEVITKDPATWVHEIFHSVGWLNFDSSEENGAANSLMEGVNDSIRRSYLGEDYNNKHNSGYDRAVLLANILYETFGVETVKGAYFTPRGYDLKNYIMKLDPGIEESDAISMRDRYLNDLELMSKTGKSNTILQDIQEMPFLKGQENNKLLQLYINILTGGELPFKLKSYETISDVNIDYWNPKNPDGKMYYMDVNESVGVTIRDESGRITRTVDYQIPKD